MATGGSHPNPTLYVKIAIVLAVLTAIEVALFYTESVVGAATIPALLALAAAKFVLVVGFYMHLKFDAPVLNKLFAVGGVMAVFVYGIVIASFTIFR